MPPKRPLTYVLYYEDAQKFAAHQRDFPDEQPDPSDLESAAEAPTLYAARSLGRDLLAQGHGTPLVFERVGIARSRNSDGLLSWEYDEEFVEDV